MDAPILYSLGSVLVALAGAAFLLSAVRTRRHKERLVALGRRHALGLVHGALHDQAVHQARRFAARRHRVRLKDVLVGEDGEGRFYLALRKVGRSSHHVLFCEIASQTNVEGFHVAPLAAAGSTSRLPWRRSHRIEAGKDWLLDLRWTSPRGRWLDGLSLGVGARVLGHTARLGEQKGAVPVGVEIHHRNLLVHSTEPLRGARVDRFVDDAIKLRRQIINALHNVNEKSKDAPKRSSRSVLERYGDVQVQVIR